MPSGEVHYKFYNAGFLLEIPTFIYVATLNPIVGVGHFVGYFSHRWVDNDWDILSVNKSESRAIKELKLFGYIVFMISSLYGAIFRRKHRSFITHFPVISTAVRMCFLFFWIPILIHYGYMDLSPTLLKFFLGFLMGLSQADAQHFLADMFWTENYFERRKK